MRYIWRYVIRLWTTDVGLTTLLVSLLVYIFLLIPLQGVTWVRLFASVLWSLILIAGAITVSRNRVFRGLVFSWALFAFISLWAQHLFVHKALVFIHSCLSLVFLVLLTCLILEQVFRQGPTTSYRIIGAVAAYLLLGVIWSLAYYLIALSVPEAFTMGGAIVLGDEEALRSQLFYFSFVTLTTLGYGDIVAVHPVVRMLVILESVAGQLFLTILIARLVSLHIQSTQGT